MARRKLPIGDMQHFLPQILLMPTQYADNEDQSRTSGMKHFSEDDIFPNRQGGGAHE